MLVPKLRFKRDDGTDYTEWEEKQLKSVCDIVGGGTPSTEHQEYWNGDIQWFTPSEIVKSKYVTKSERTISQIGFEKSSARKLPVGTILLTSRATLGEMAIPTEECTTNQGLQSLIPQTIYGEYLYYLQPIIKRYCNKNACGSTFNEISKNELGKCKIPVPCFEEQRKIADFLSNVDEVIEQSEKEVQNLEQQKKAAMQKIFSQEVRFKREDGTDYPEWVEKPLKSVCNFFSSSLTTDSCNDNGEYSLFDANGQIGFCDNGYNDRSIAIIKDGAGVGRLARLPPKSNCLGTMGLLTTIDVDLEFLYQILSFISLKKYVIGGAIPHIYFRDYGQHLLYVPCPEEQQKIADFLSAVDEVISYAKQELKKLKELKKGLFQQMFV